MYIKDYIIINIVFFSAFILYCDTIKVKQVTTNLRCNDWSDDYPSSKSNIVQDISTAMLCSPSTNHFTRIQLEVRTSSSSETERFETSLNVLGSDINIPRSTSNGQGCTSDTTDSVNSKTCTKLTSSMQVPGSSLLMKPGLGLSEILQPKIIKAIEEGRLQNNVFSSIENVIQSVRLEVEISATRWVWDLNKDPDYVVPFAYFVHINETKEAYEEAINITQSNSESNNGIKSKLSRCVPNLHPDTGRIPGKLGGCFRAPCNCSNTVDPGIPEFYTFEMHTIAPLCEMRKIQRNGRPRLSATLVLKLYLISSVTGIEIDKRLILTKKFWDLTSSFPGSATDGDIGLSGLANRVMTSITQNSANGIKIGSTDIEISTTQFASALASSFQSILFSSKLVDSFQIIDPTLLSESTTLNNSTKISPDQNTLAWDTAPVLSSGYVVDCLTDEQLRHSKYRNSGSTPYNDPDLYAESVAQVNPAPLDKWFYMSDGVSRTQHLFSTLLQNSCGYVGFSSAALALDTKSLSQLCCDPNLPLLDPQNSKCIPGSTHQNSSNTPEQILDSSSIEAAKLFRDLFSPDGWDGHNYFMNGRYTLNRQPVIQEISGESNIINALPTGVFEITLEISDMILEAMSGGVRSSAYIPQLNTSNLDQPVQCTYSSDGSGRGVFYFPKICNSDYNGGTAANVSVSFKGCTGVSSLSTEFPIHLNGQVLAGECKHDTFVDFIADVGVGVQTLSSLMTIPHKDQPRCSEIVISATRGSTKEITFHNIGCLPVYGIFDQRPPEQRKELNIVILKNDLTTKDEQTIKCDQPDYCDYDDLTCLYHCNQMHKSPVVWFMMILPVLLLILLFFLLLIWQLVIQHNQKIEISTFKKKN